MKNKILLQIIFWTVVLGLNIAILSRFDELDEDLIAELGYFAAYVFLFYTNVQILFPKYYIKNRSEYFLISLGCIVLFLAAGSVLSNIMDYFSRDFHRRYHHFRIFSLSDMFIHTLWMLLVYLSGTIYSIQDMLNQQIRNNKIIAEEKLQTELRLLKSQINPHFLFNALNNIYSLAYTKSKRAPESILKLSDMLRYVIEDCSREYVTLNSEVEYIGNLIDFYKMKSPGERNVKFTYKIENPDTQIAPLLFVPFIENAFKYSRIEEDVNGYIIIALEEAGRRLSFTAANSVFAERKILKGSGQGISNVRQRLEIIYPGRHSLKFEGDELNFNVWMDLELRIKN